ncbi:MAG TPA: metalloregulator ArsR/SmtB family transcription factor [Candidatus Saccharimonadales bacterium]|nr:metalloregulator ArsR/SmtB family transcription factor [Candidatus Saccharimonadales bacterium]
MKRPEESRWPAIFKALGHPLRFRLYLEACARPLTVTELVSISGRSQPAVSQYLNALRRAGLVRVTRKGRNMIYEALPVDWSATRSMEALGLNGAPTRPAAPAPAEVDVFPEFSTPPVPAARDSSEDYLL